MWSVKNLKKKIVVIGCGNSLLGDDGFGPAVVEKLEKAGLDAELLDAGTDETAVVKALGGCGTAIVVDAAAKKGTAPGELLEIELADGKELGKNSSVPTGAHGMDLAHALKTAKAIGNWPEKILLVGTAPQRLDGAGLSPAVEKAVAKAVERIAAIAKSRNQD